MADRYRRMHIYLVQKNEEALPHKLTPSVQSPTTPHQYNLLRNEEALLLLMDPKFTEPYYTKTVEPIEKYRHTQCRQTPPNQAQVNRALLHQISITYCKMKRPSPMKWLHVYRALLHQTSTTYWEMSRPSPVNWPQMYGALLHQASSTYWEIQTYPVQTDPPNQAQVKQEPYYTKSV